MRGVVDNKESFLLFKKYGSWKFGNETAKYCLLYDVFCFEIFWTYATMQKKRGIENE